MPPVVRSLPPSVLPCLVAALVACAPAASPKASHDPVDTLKADGTVDVATYPDLSETDVDDGGVSDADITTPNPLADAAVSSDANRWSPKCGTAGAVGMPCSPVGLPCIPGTKGVCACSGCVCKKTKATKQTCPGQSGCECKEHWHCDTGVCVPFPTEHDPQHRQCAHLCVDACPTYSGLPVNCTQITDACDDKRFVCLPEGVTQGDLGLGEG